MSARLGEMLLKVGALTRAQLDQVLNAQSIYGGRLGTNLVEMGMICEEDLAKALHEKLGVPCIDPAVLNSLPKELLSLVPAELVERYRVLPVSLEGKKLTLAMADPADFKAIEEIGFVTGLVIIPRVCTELRLNLALERYFGLKRAVRYIPVKGGFHSRLAGAVSAKAAGPLTVQEAKGVGGSPRVTLNALADQLSTAAGEAQVVACLLDYLDCEYDRAAFLTLKSGQVVGVKGIADGFEIAGISGCSIPLEDAPRIKQVVQEGGLFLGELAGEGAEGKLLQAMGGAPILPTLLMPVSASGKVAALLCVQDGKGGLAGGVFNLQRVVAMAELTFEMICLKKRIKAG